MARLSSLFIPIADTGYNTRFYNNGHLVEGNDSGSNGWTMYKLFNPALPDAWAPSSAPDLTVTFSKAMRIARLDLKTKSTSGTTISTSFEVSCYAENGSLISKKTVTSTTAGLTNFSNIELVKKINIKFSVRTYLREFQIYTLPDKLSLIQIKNGLYTVDDYMSLISLNKDVDALTMLDMYTSGFNAKDLATPANATKTLSAIKKIDPLFKIITM